MADVYKARLTCDTDRTGQERAVCDIQFIRGMTGWGLREAKQFWDRKIKGNNYLTVEILLSGEQVARLFTEYHCKQAVGNLRVDGVERTVPNDTIDMRHTVAS